HPRRGASARPLLAAQDHPACARPARGRGDSAERARRRRRRQSAGVGKARHGRGLVRRPGHGRAARARGRARAGRRVVRRIHGGGPAGCGDDVGRCRPAAFGLSLRDRISDRRHRAPRRAVVVPALAGARWRAAGARARRCPVRRAHAMSAAYAGDIRSREAWAAEGHLAELTSVRFFAAAAVLLGHFQDMLGMPDTVAALVGGGQYVSLFFALSGFILTYRYWDTFSGGVERGALRRFLVARFARIYPSYVLALVALTIVYAVESHDHPGSILYPGNLVVSWLVNLFALQTFARSVPTQQYWNSPSWSVSTELCFYLMFPLLVLWIARHCRTRAALLGLLAASIALSAALYAATLVLVFDHGWQRELWLDLVATRNVFWRTHQFVIGVVGARLLYGGHLPWLSRPAARNALLVASLALVTAMNLAPWPADDHAIMILRPYRLEIAYLFPFAGII